MHVRTHSPNASQSPNAAHTHTQRNLSKNSLTVKNFHCTMEWRARMVRIWVRAATIFMID